MKCPICNKDMACMTPLHAKMHNLTMQEMRQKFKVTEYSDALMNEPHEYSPLSITKPYTARDRRAFAIGMVKSKNR